MLWNLMNDEEYGPLKLLKLKYSRECQITQNCSRIVVDTSNVLERYPWIVQNTYKSNGKRKMSVQKIFKIEADEEVTK